MSEPSSGGARGFRKRVRAWSKPLGLDDAARRAYVEAGRVGERALALWSGPLRPEDAILLVSGGRSGSTWVADILCACAGVQQIFEPLHPGMVREVQELTGWSDTHDPHIRSHYLRPGADHRDWDDFLRRLLAGRVRNYWTDAVRTSWWPRRYVIKVIRGNLLVGHVVDRFSPSVVFLVRNPYSVVASRVAAGWFAEARDLLAQEELVEDYLRPWICDLESEPDLLGIHAAWWAIETRVAADQLATRPHHFATYEGILEDPLRRMLQMAAALDLAPDGMETVDFAAPSRMANATSEPGSGGDYARRSAQRLDDTQRARIRAWAERLEVDWYDADGTPRVECGRVPGASA